MGRILDYGFTIEKQTKFDRDCFVKTCDKKAQYTTRCDLPGGALASTLLCRDCTALLAGLMYGATTREVNKFLAEQPENQVPKEDDILNVFDAEN